MPPRLLNVQVANQLRTAILDGTLGPGERLHDDELAPWLGVSRATVRGACARLASDGLLEIVPNRSVRVVTPRPAEVLDALATLGCLFGGVVRLSVPVMTADQKHTTSQRLAAEVVRLRSGGSPSVVLTASGGYQAWLDICPNRMVVEMCTQSMHGLAYKLRVDDLGSLVPASHLIEWFPRLGAAVESDDAVGAERAVKAIHLVD
ncbi:DNA-binding transcriptional regulator, GntR family [Curtobacterium sp. UNCCL20]|nr:DNA-binding transcriptional regulator, GntR family [Curtobacterium sp. UNCCL20]